MVDIERGALTEELGRSGVYISGGTVYEEFLPALTGSKAYKVYREMRDNDYMVSAILFAIEMLIRRVPWDVQEASDANEDMIAKDFLKSNMDDMSVPWSEVISEILTMLPFGFAPLEIVYKWRRGQSDVPSTNSRFDDNYLGWRKLALRSQETVESWKVDDSGGIQGLVQRAPPSFQTIPIPIERLLIFRTIASKGNPEGRSILRSAYRPWMFKKREEEIEGIGIERDLAGLPVIWAPARIMAPNANEADKTLFQTLKRIVTNVRRDHQEGVVMPLQYDEGGHKMFDFELMSTGSRRQFDTNQIISRHDKEIAITVMADIILLGHEKVGSYSLGVSKEEMFVNALQTWINSIADTFNRHAVPRLFKLNGMQVSKLPELTPGKVEIADISGLGDFISKIAGSGAPIWPDDELENHLRRTAGLPERAEPSEDVKPRQAEMFGLPTNGNGGPPDDEKTDDGDAE